jgi:hypothetical protein
MEHTNNNMWTRREMLKTIAALTGGTLVGASAFLSGCKDKRAANIQFTAAEIALLDEIGETIIPATDTPGAKATEIGKFMQVIVKDCYTKEEQDAFVQGLGTWDALCKKQTGKTFMEASAAERKAFILTLEKEAKPFDAKVDEEEKKEREAAKKQGWKAEVDYQRKPRHYYSMIKGLTVWGFFSSKIGMTVIQNYQPVPGKYDGAYPYKKGDKMIS